MAGTKNDVLVGKNADFTQVNAPNATSSEANGLVSNGKLWIGSSALNAGGTHINVGNLTSPGNTLTIGYSSPNITLDVNSSSFDLHTARFIVSAGGIANGANYTTIASAYAAAVSAGGPQTVFVQDGTYTENITLSASVNICSFTSSGLGIENSTPNVNIIGKITASYNGTVCLSGLKLTTNSDFCIVLSALTSTLLLFDCFINANNNTAISMTAAGKMYLFSCNGSLNTTGIAFFSKSNGDLFLIEGLYQNPGSSVTASTCSGGLVDLIYAIFANPISTSSTGSLNSHYSIYEGIGNNTILTLNGTGAGGIVDFCAFDSGSASAISIGVGVTLQLNNCSIISSNTNVITGAGSITYGGVTFSGASSGTNVTSETYKPLTVKQGGTFASTFTPYSVICAGTSATGAFQNVSGVGTSGQVLTSNGASNLPSWQAGAASISITGDTGGALTGSSFTIFANAATENAGSSVSFSGTGTTLTLNTTDANTNTFIGNGVGKSGTAATFNSGLGTNSYNAITTNGDFNNMIGANIFRLATSATKNQGMGFQALDALLTGTLNIAIGHNAGLSYASSESSNICIGGDVQGTAAESNVLRIGNGTTTGGGGLTKAFIAGIQTIVVTGTPVLVSTSDQLGVAVSSSKFKQDIKDMGSDSDKMMNLRPVTFQWRKDSCDGLKDSTDERQFGLIAEEVHKVFPYLCSYDKNGKPFSVKYHEMAALLLNEIQKLSKRISELEKSN